MGSILNGMALHGGFRPYGSTFLVFADYMRPSIRLAAMMGLPVIYVFTHDSVGVGEDGPTHQPVEQIASLRVIPQLVVIRPADANETVEAWRVALHRVDGPTVLALTRQRLPVLQGLAAVERGAYTLSDAPQPAAVLIASGSEVSVALEAQALLKQEDIETRVVSMPSWELFDAQPQSYQDSVLPPTLPRVVVEAGVRVGWDRWAGCNSKFVTIDRFGASGPYQAVMEKLGITPENVVRQIKSLLA